VTWFEEWCGLCGEASREAGILVFTLGPLEELVSRKACASTTFMAVCGAAGAVIWISGVVYSALPKGLRWMLGTSGLA
jgi:hypothetical protein